MRNFAIFIICVIPVSFATIAESEGTSTSGIKLYGKCTLTDKCQLENAACISGICQCKPGTMQTLTLGLNKGSNNVLFCAEIAQINKIITVEDHPWVIKNETCLSSTASAPQSCRNSSCYSGYLIDLLRLIDGGLKNLDNCTISEAAGFGTVDMTDSPSHDGGMMELLSKNETDLALGMFNVTASNTKIVMQTKHTLFSTPIIRNTVLKKYFAIGFPYSTKAKNQYDAMINKLISQRHLEQLLLTWFQENTAMWKKEKALTKYEPISVCHWM